MGEPKSKISVRIEHLIRVNHPDPDVARRGRLLNVLLLGTFVAAIACAVVGLIANIANDWAHEDEILLLATGVMGAIFVSALYFLNRSHWMRLAPIVFLLGFIFLISFSDVPLYLVAGRSTMVYVIPIIMASVLMRPAASFMMAALSGVALVAIAVVNNLDPVPLYSTIPIEIIQFFIIALVGWLSARSLEQALADLRTMNRELDRRVADRTSDLAEALIRVQTESSQTQAILESIADGVIVFDATGKASAANPAIARLLNLPATQIIGYKIETLMAGMVSVQDQTAVLGQVRSQESAARLPAIRLQWGEKTLSASFAPIHIRHETGHGTVAVFRDVTREAELERMKSAFVSMVSHELRTPLGAILGYGEMLREQVAGPLNPKQLSVLERLMTNSRRLIGMVNDLLDRAQLEAGRLTLIMAPFSPQQLLDDLVATTAPMIKNKGLHLATIIAPAVPDTLQGDAQRLLQILINLVGNATKFTDQGSISVYLDRTNESHWAMHVADTGIGIPPDEQPYVFDMFRQVDSSTTRKHSGAGLGLSIVKQLVTLMGGEISLISEVGHGTTFTVTLPLLPVPEKEYHE